MTVRIVLTDDQGSLSVDRNYETGLVTLTVTSGPDSASITVSVEELRDLLRPVS